MLYNPSPETKPTSSRPKCTHILMMGISESSVVTWASKARFFTKPQDSPSGVSEGQIIPQWEGWSALGPDIFLVFSN